MSDQVNVEELRNLLNEHKPVPYTQMNATGTLIDMWHVLEGLLILVEAQGKEIKALGDAIQGDGK